MYYYVSNDNKYLKSKLGFSQLAVSCRRVEFSNFDLMPICKFSWLFTASVI